MLTLQITLNPSGVATPAQHAAIVSTDVVAAALTAFAEGNLAKPTMPDQFVQLQIRGPELTSDERRMMYENWLLAKGFQDLARGVRESLEEAALYLALISRPTRSVPTSISLEDLFDTMRKPAARLPFPELLARVNAGLTSPLEFEREFLSIQRVRNCLEHRGGMVRKQDLDDQAAALTLSFPRLKVFYMRGNEEIELARDERVDDGTHEPEVQILGRIGTRSRTYQLGERVTFTANEFSEIAMACSFFAKQLASRLPVISAP
jgi:hypothetical protein